MRNRWYISYCLILLVVLVGLTSCRSNENASHAGPTAVGSSVTPSLTAKDGSPLLGPSSPTDAEDATALASSTENSTPQIPLKLSPTPGQNEPPIPTFTPKGDPQPILDTEAIKELLPDGLECSTPKSLMLHSAFGKKRMEELAQKIIEQGWHTSTYRKIVEDLLHGICPPQDTIVVSLDDLGTSWLRLDFIDMVEVFIEYELVLVIGAVVEGPQDSDIWDMLKTWQSHGIEIASHTLSHYHLPLLSDVALEEQVSGSYQIICDNLGTCPITLILTFGSGGDDPRIVKAAHEYIFLIGMQGGRSFGQETPFYLGRIPPNNEDQSITVNLLENSFEP